MNADENQFISYLRLSAFIRGSFLFVSLRAPSWPIYSTINGTAQSKQFDVERRVSARIAVDLHGHLLLRFDSDATGRGVQHAFDVQVFTNCGAEQEIQCVAARGAGQNADVEQSVIAAGVGEQGKAGAVFGDVADERDAGAGAEERSIVDDHADRGIGISAEREGGGENVADVIDRALPHGREFVNDLAIDADAGHQQEQSAIGAARIHVTNFALADGGHDSVRIAPPTESEVFAHQIRRAERNDGDWRQRRFIERLDQPIRHRAERAISADDHCALAAQRRIDPP